MNAIDYSSLPPDYSMEDDGDLSTPNQRLESNPSAIAVLPSYASTLVDTRDQSIAQTHSVSTPYQSRDQPRAPLTSATRPRTTHATATNAGDCCNVCLSCCYLVTVCLEICTLF